MCSKLKLIKNYLRSLTDQERFSTLVILSIKIVLLKSIGFNHAISKCKKQNVGKKKF